MTENRKIASLTPGPATFLHNILAVHTVGDIEKGMNGNVRQTSRSWVVLPPMLFFLKDVIATTALLSTEPGITAKAVFYYSLGLLPGSLVADSATTATVVNVLFGALLGLTLFFFLRFLRSKRSSLRVDVH